MKFHEYITQRRAFGRTPWLRAILIWGLSGTMIVGGVWLLVERDLWGLAPLLVGIGVRCILGFGTKDNWETDKAREEKGSGSPHRKTVCENCNPPCWRSTDPAIDGSPLDLISWVMATQHCTEDVAKDKLYMSPAYYTEMHDEYLDHPKFRKFKTK